MTLTYVRVVVDAPLEQPLDYALERNGDSTPLAGRLCVAPLGRRQVVGLIVAEAPAPSIEAERVRLLVRLFDDIAPLVSPWLALTEFAAAYYQHAWGEVAIPALPPPLRAVPGARFAAALKRARARPLTSDRAPPAPFAPTDAQRAALAQIGTKRGFAPLLLFGVTGSGKTAVYLEAMAARLAADPAAQVLLLVPEINLTPQLEQRLRARFPHEPLAAMHSGMAAGERLAAWLAAHEGRARIVVGTRLAVFASLPRLALIVVDEEHDPSFKAGDGPRYSARDLAVKRAQIEGVPVLLGSATPSLESWSRAAAGRYARLDLPQRAAGDAAWPQVEPVDLRRHRPEQGLAEPVRVALAATQARGEQSLVFLNRRGYAPVIACEACGWLSGCPRCAVFSAFHKPDATLRCHHCGWQARVPRACPTCGNSDLRAVGHGTQRIEETLQALLPAARIARIDRDSTRRRHSAQSAFDAVHAGDVDVLVGTQMIAKGHDFRRVSLVVVLNCDAQLVAPDFRAPERLFATLLQVAGRAGRAGLASRVLVQTRYPDHPLLAALARHDFAAFARQQLAERRAAQLPPFVHQALLTAEARALPAALDFLAQARTLRAAPAAVRFYDPVPMPLARLADVHRAQLVIESDSRNALQAHLTAWLPAVRAAAQAARPRLRWQIEVDPLQI